jgi:hypothetical protein
MICRLFRRFSEGQVKIVPEALGDLLSQPDFATFHHDCAEFPAKLRRFLNATMDEVRLSTSSRVALDILNTIGISDAAHFREAVLRRELFGNIAYPKQRDHSSHTLYNYLLGWYFFTYCAPLKAALVAEFEKRGVPKAGVEPFENTSKYFGCVWQYASLLHDIGYMFEGSRSRMDFRATNEQAEIGARVAREYFNRIVWLEYGVDLAAMRDRLFESLGSDLRPPAFEQTDTLGGIADELRTVGNLGSLLGAVGAELDRIRFLADRKPGGVDLANDGLELWAHHYDRFEKPDMAKRIRSMRKIFNGLIDRGLPDINVCLLDHGVCGGLLQLTASTYYYRLRAKSLEIAEPRPQFVQRIIDVGPWSPAFWWTGIVWGTAAVGIHNIQQMSKLRQFDPDWPGLLPLTDDPLAYLGILVDIIQEWNRYSVFKDLDREPIQGIEVKLGVDHDRVVVQFLEPNASDRAGNLIKELNKALAGWSDLVEVRS